MQFKKSFLFLILLATTVPVVPWVLAAPNAVIQNDSGYIDRNTPYFLVVGEVLNTGDVPLIYVEITATLKDSLGEKIDESFDFLGIGADVLLLPPGAKAPFDIVHDLSTVGKSPSDVSTYTLALSYEQADPVAHPMLAVNLEVINTRSSVDSIGMLVVDGEVKNTGSTTSNSTQVVGTFYDAGGKVVYVDNFVSLLGTSSTWTSRLDIPPGQTGNFSSKVVNSDIAPKVKAYSFFAQSLQYTSLTATAATTTTTAATATNTAATTTTTTASTSTGTSSDAGTLILDFAVLLAPVIIIVVAVLYVRARLRRRRPASGLITVQSPLGRFQTHLLVSTQRQWSLSRHSPRYSTAEPS